MTKLQDCCLRVNLKFLLQFKIGIFSLTVHFISPSEGSDTAVHPYWNPTFLGNTIMVNGLVWPNMDVKQGQYRLRILDGSNSRFYTLHFSNNMPFTQIGSDGGYLKAPVTADFPYYFAW